MAGLTRDLGRVLKSHWKDVLTISGLFVGIILLLNVGFWAVSRDARSCNVCHIMEPYYDQWKTSTHANVTCIKCHPNRPATIALAAIKYVSGTYNPRPHAVVEDKACLSQGCHAERLINPVVKFKGSIPFNHDEHLGHLKRGKRLRCASCHSHIVQGEHMAVT